MSCSKVRGLGLSHPQARKRHININFVVRLVLGRPRVCPDDFTGFVPGTNLVKTWDKPGFSPYFTQWKPGKPGFVPGTNPGLSPGINPGSKGGTESLCEKSSCVFFARYIQTKSNLINSPRLLSIATPRGAPREGCVKHPGASVREEATT